MLETEGAEGLVAGMACTLFYNNKHCELGITSSHCIIYVLQCRVMLVIRGDQYEIETNETYDAPVWRTQLAKLIDTLRWPREL